MYRTIFRRVGFTCLQLSVLVFAASCGKGSDKTETSAPAPAQQPQTPAPAPTPPAPVQGGVPEPVPAPKPHPAPKPQPTPVPGHLPPEDSSVGEPAWGDSSGRHAWTDAVRRVAFARLHDLERAGDKEVYCPGYSEASINQRLNCWVLIVSAISKFESNFNTSDSFREPDGNYSVGLLALSTGECPNAETVPALSEAVPNLVCGTNKMASLIAKVGWIDAAPGTKPEVSAGHGAASYWSTLRPRYKVWDPTRHRYLTLGYKSEILALVRDYRGRKGGDGGKDGTEVVMNSPLFRCRSVETPSNDLGSSEPSFKPVGFELTLRSSGETPGGVMAEARAGGKSIEVKDATLVTVPAAQAGPALEIARAMYPDRGFAAFTNARIANVPMPSGQHADAGYAAYELLDGNGNTLAKVVASGLNYARCGK